MRDWMEFIPPFLGLVLIVLSIAMVALIWIGAISVWRCG